MPISSPAAVRQDVAMGNGRRAGTVGITQIVGNPISLADLERIEPRPRTRAVVSFVGAVRKNPGHLHISRFDLFLLRQLEKLHPCVNPPARRSVRRLVLPPRTTPQRAARHGITTPARTANAPWHRPPPP